MEFLLPELLELVNEELNAVDRYFLSKTSLTPSIDIKSITQEESVKASVEQLELLKEEGYNWSNDVCNKAVCNLEALKWFVSQGCPWNELTCSYETEDGHLK